LEGKLSKSQTSVFIAFSLILLGLSCSGPDSDQPVLTAEVPLHLEEHLDSALIEGSEVPEDVLGPVEWSFDEPQPEWKAAGPVFTEEGVVRLESTEESLRIHFSEEANRTKNSKMINGAVYVDLPDWRREDWGEVLVRARSSDPFSRFHIDYNLGERMQPGTNLRSAILYAGDSTRIVSDGDVHTYKLRVDFHREDWGEWEDPWRQLILSFVAPSPASIDLLSVSVIPREYHYADAPVGVRTSDKLQAHRRAIYVHTPGRIEYRVQVPESGRLDFGLGVIREDVPVTFKILASQGDNEEIALFEGTYSNPKEWAERSVDLSGMTGKNVKIALIAEAEQTGTVALWTAPTISGFHTTKKPNVIFYVIDGGAADFMSVYGYNRRTTPNIERLAKEGALFEYAYSNSTWTKPSTTSFMTSLQNSLLDNSNFGRFQPLPKNAKTMAQHFHELGYQTAVFTTNTWAGSLSGLERGVDVMRDAWAETDATSSRELHQNFWDWREAYPGEPYWVHFQTTDVHEGYEPVAPFAGLFLSPEERKFFDEQERKLGAWMRKNRSSIAREPYVTPKLFEGAGVNRVSYFNGLRSLYDECMSHQDYQLGRLVERLKVNGEWDNTLLIVAADHSVDAAATDIGAMLQETLPPPWEPMFRSTITRVPMIFVWSGHIEGGQRFIDPVSMIDMLPTVLDLLDMPLPEVMQGQSLAPLLLGKNGWEPRPVILEEIATNPRTGKVRAAIEVIDGRWGASLSIIDEMAEAHPEIQRPSPLLLYDLREDPFALHSLHEEYPDLVEKYTTFLKDQWKAHQALAKLFISPEEAQLTPDQLETLRSLGYIR
jgi:arylsulfatase A-like enzyme